jgi:hypothetical protein
MYVKLIFMLLIGHFVSLVGHCQSLPVFSMYAGKCCYSKLFQEFIGYSMGESEHSLQLQIMFFSEYKTQKG